MDWKLELIVVPVRDLDRAKAFYAEQLGFVVDHDTRVSDTLRIIQLTPPGSGCSINLRQAAETSTVDDMAAGSLRGTLVVVDDLVAAREQLIGREVDVTPVRRFEDGEWRDGAGGRWNAFVFFDDPDGNGWVLQERPADDSTQ